MSPGNHRVVAEAETGGSGRDPAVSRVISVCQIASGDLWAGAEVQIAAMIRYLARKNDIRLSAILLNHGRLAEEIERLGVETIVIPESQTGFFGVLRRAEDFLRTRKPHILHSHRYKENLLAALLARRFRIAALVRTQHGLQEPLRGLKGSKHALIQTFDRMTARWSAARIIGVSSDVTLQLRQRLGREKIVTILNGVDVENAQSSLSAVEARQGLGIPEDSFVFGTAGRLEPIKRLDIFLKAAKQISVQHPGAQFILAGDGRERSNLTELTRTLGIEDRVHFLGHRDDIFDVLRALDVLVICSDHEGLPMILLEAMCMRLPVVARRVGGIPEVIEDRITGVLVESDSPSDLATACLATVEDGTCRQRLVEAARNLVIRDFSAERAGAQVADLYRSLVKAQ